MKKALVLGGGGRNSDNNVFREKIGWESQEPLQDGMEKTYAWISQQVAKLAVTNI